MFDLLNQIRASWKENEFIVIHDPENEKYGTFVCIPAQYFQKSHFIALKSHMSDSLRIWLSYEFFRQAEIPVMDTIFTGISSIYPVISLMANQGSEEDQKQSLTLSLKGDKPDYSADNIILTIDNIVQLVEEYEINRIKRFELINRFGKVFKTPGTVKLMRSSNGLLTKSMGIGEISVALCQITDCLEAMVVVPLLNENGNLLKIKETNDFAQSRKLVLADKKTLINLWRSIKKIPKSKMAINY